MKNANYKYYSKLTTELSLPKTSPKAFWSILKSFLIRNKFLSLLHLYHNDNLFTEFKRKAKLFNYFVAQKCSIMQNNNKHLEKKIAF